MSELRPAAVAVIDALGFKGIWKKGPKDVLETMLALRDAARAEVKFGDSPGEKPPEVTMTTFSDTIVIGVANSEGGETPAGSLVGIMTLLIASVLIRNYHAKVPIPFRGCVAFGPCSIQSDLFVGPAIDEAAEWAEAADAAIVWLCPSAAATGKGDGLSLLPWSVPMTTGGVFQTHALNPFFMGTFPRGPAFFDPARIRRTTLSRFEDSSDVRVAIKRQNTERFLDAAEAYSRDWWERNPWQGNREDRAADSSTPRDGENNEAP